MTMIFYTNNKKSDKDQTQKQKRKTSSCQIWVLFVTEFDSVRRLACLFGSEGRQARRDHQITVQEGDILDL